MEKAADAARIYKYVMTCEFDNEAMKLNILKLHNSRLVHAFESTNTVKKPKVNASQKNWGFIMIPKNVKLANVKELLYFQKIHYRHHWYEFEEWITESNITELVVVEML